MSMSMREALEYMKAWIEDGNMTVEEAALLAYAIHGVDMQMLLIAYEERP